MPVQIQLRRDTAADWISTNPVLALGEIGIETDTVKIKIGDGSTAWNSLPYFTPAASPLYGDVGYTVQGGAYMFSPADSTAYYFGCMYSQAPNSSPNLAKLPILVDGWIRRVSVFFYNSGTLGSAEASSLYVRINDSVDYLVSAVVKNDASTGQFTTYDLSIPVAKGDTFEFKWVTPAWATNPTNVRIAGFVYIDNVPTGTIPPPDPDLDLYGAGANDTGEPLGGGEGYSGILTTGTHVVATKAELKDHLVGGATPAGSGDSIFLAGTTTIDLTGEVDLWVPAGVTLASNRGYSGSPGGLLKTDTLDSASHYHVLLNLMAGSRFTGLRLQGPDNYLWRPLGDTHEYWTGVQASGVAGAVIDNIEAYYWNEAATRFGGAACVDGILKHSNVHHNSRYGFGYGCQVAEATASIIACLMDYNRHCITSERDYPVSQYEAYFNEFGPNCLIGQAIDIHGGNDVSNPAVPAGGSFKIHHNTFKTVTGYPTWTPTPCSIRGVPLVGAEFYFNWFYYNAPYETFLIYQSCGNIGGSTPQVPWNKVYAHDNWKGLTMPT
jgi:hypothetical protein